jgi:hypothetical protein
MSARPCECRAEAWQITAEVRGHGALERGEVALGVRPGEVIQRREAEAVAAALEHRGDDARLARGVVGRCNRHEIAEIVPARSKR